MNLHRAKPFFEWNLNTAILVFGFGITWGVFKTDLSNTKSAVAEVVTDVAVLTKTVNSIEGWKNTHEEISKNRRGEIEGGLSTVTEKVANQDERMDDVETTQLEQTIGLSTAATRIAEVQVDLRSLTAAVNNVQSDQKLILSYIAEQRERDKDEDRAASGAR